MDRARHELLPRSVFARDEHPRRRDGDFLDLAGQRPDRVGLADDLEPRFDRFAESRVLFLQRVELQGIAQEDQDAIRVERLLRSEEHASELQSQSNLVCRLLLEKKKKKKK